MKGIGTAKNHVSMHGWAIRKQVSKSSFTEYLQPRVYIGLCDFWMGWGSMGGVGSQSTTELLSRKQGSKQGLDHLQ